MADATKLLPANEPAATALCPYKMEAGSSAMDIDAAVKHLEANYQPPFGVAKCAKYVREAIQAGGVPLEYGTWPGSAKDYGPYLESKGFKKISAEGYVPKKGDIIVLQGFPAGPVNPDTGVSEYKASDDGHITMYTGEKWGSDFEQRDFWGGPSYRKVQPDFAIYRP